MKKFFIIMLVLFMSVSAIIGVTSSVKHEENRKDEELIVKDSYEQLISDLERLGDHAEDVLEFSLKLKNTEKHSNEEINKVVKLTLSMVKDSIESYLKQDYNLAQTVIDRDDIVDEMYSSLIESIIQMSNKERCSSSFAVYTTLVVKYIERIADHAVNIAEWVIYIISGFHKDKKII